MGINLGRYIIGRPRPDGRCRGRRVVSILTCLGLLGLLAIASAAPVAAAEPSPGCLKWDAFGAAGARGDSMVVDGPFFEGETLAFTIDPATPVDTSILIRYLGQTRDIGTFRGPYSFVVPEQIPDIAIYGDNDGRPGLWTLTDFECVLSAVGPTAPRAAPPTDIAASSATPSNDPNLGFVAVVLAGLAGAMVVLGPVGSSLRDRRR